MNFSTVQCFHTMASTFVVKQLMEDSGRLFHKILAEDASFHSQLSLLEYAVETGDSLPQEDCLQFLAWNFQNLTTSPAWPNVSIKVLTALLSRSDLVVPDEYTVLQSVEGWITKKANMISFESQVDLLSHVRFPMISPEKLYELENGSPLYKTHTDIYRGYMLKAPKFSVLTSTASTTSPGSTHLNPGALRSTHQNQLRYNTFTLPRTARGTVIMALTIWCCPVPLQATYH